MISLFKMMPEYAVQWFVANSIERRAEPQEVLIRENTPVNAIFIVLSGLLGIYLGDDGDCIGTLGTGTVLGEMSFVDDSPSSATVIVREKSLLLEVSREKLQEKIGEDARFAADFYKALAATLSERVRKTNEKLSAAQEAGREGGKTVPEELRKTRQITLAFREAAARADLEMLETGKVETETYHQLRGCFLDVIHYFHEALGRDGIVPHAYREQIGARLQYEILPHVLFSDTAERFYTKPRGYAADYESVERIYAQRPSGKGRIGSVLDRLFLESPVAAAVRNRRDLFAREIVETAAAKNGATVHVLGVACGPARELLDAFQKLPDGGKPLNATLIDIDAQALAFAGAWRDKAGLSAHINLVNENLIKLALGRSRTDLPPQDLIYSTGLIDYFDDRQAVKLLNFMHSLLAPGGKVLLGGFHPGNVCKEFMEYLLEWHVHHRGEDELDAIFRQSAFGRPCTGYRHEAEKVNFFAECVRE